MLPNRENLVVFADSQFVGRDVDVLWKTEKRHYQLEEMVGKGQTGIAWRVADGLGRRFALKFVLRSDYRTHSLDAEAQRVNALQSRLFAKIEYFGEPQFTDNMPACDSFYAIVVDWIDGQSLNDLLTDPATTINPDAFLRLARDLCEVLQSLKDKQLCHSDLHDKNVLIRRQHDVLSNTESLQIAVIDTGQLKTEQRRLDLLESWQHELASLEAVARMTTQSLSPQRSVFENGSPISIELTKNGSFVTFVVFITACTNGFRFAMLSKSDLSVTCRNRYSR